MSEESSIDRPVLPGALASASGYPGDPPGDDAGSRWYAVQCHAHRERAAALHLANQAFFVFLPLREKSRRHARRIETVRAPFFPGYLFVRLDSRWDRWRSVNGTFGVARLVMQGERPAPVPRGVVEALRDSCSEGGILRLRADLSPGQSVRVLTGPFADFIGRLDRLADAGRVRVLLDIMGGRTPVLLARESVEPASPSG
jgi:transcriptional antiterminator RfaH